MGNASFMFVHNAWGMIVGNRHDMAEAIEMFEQFDDAIADIYHARTGVEMSKVRALMDGETLMGAKKTVEQKFADSVDASLDFEPAAAADDIPQLPDIAGPGVALEHLKHSFCKAIQWLVYVRQKVLCQKRDIPASLPESRNMQRNHV